MAHPDALTGLPNRGCCADRIQQAIAQAHRSRQPARGALHRPRPLQDHQRLPRHQWATLLQSWRAASSCAWREGDTVARVARDEFVIVIPDVASAGDASTVSAKIEVLANAFHLHGPTARGGFHRHRALSNDGADAETLMRNADTAMYHAKIQGAATSSSYAAHERRGPAAPAAENALRERSRTTSSRCTTSRSSTCATAA